MDREENASEPSNESDRVRDLQERSRKMLIHIRRVLFLRFPRLCIAGCFVVVGRILWDSRNRLLSPELRPLGENALCIAGGVISAYICYNMLMIFLGLTTLDSESPKIRQRASRGITVAAFLYAGLCVGANYVHLCRAGSRLIETVAFLGTPLVAGSLTLFIKRRSLGILLAILFLLVVWLFHRPYLDWAHGN